MKLLPLKKHTINRILFHILFWFVTIILFGYIFKISDTVGKIDIIYSILFFTSILPGVYLNLLLLIPILLNRKKYVSYILILIFIILGTTVLNQLTFSHFTDIILPNYYFVAHFNYLETGILVTTILIGTTILKLSKSWFKLQEINRKITKIEKENISNQLKTLKAQINPHFLFNSLNVLYSLALKNAKETPETIIKLSDILRYVIYDSNKEKVSIKSEVELINNYLSLQKHRIDKTSNVHFETNIKNDIHIAPMLLLPLVENSFKHGVKGDILNTFVNIKMIETNKILHFIIENNKGTSKNSDKKKDGGIGLVNIKKRLHLLYPDKHSLTINDDKQKFIVSLKINL